MPLVKRTYALPPDTLDQFEKVVEPGRRSQVVADVLNEWLDRRRQERLRGEVIEGCRAMAGLYQEIEREYHPLEEEVARGFYSKPKAGRHRPGTARSHRRR